MKAGGSSTEKSPELGISGGGSEMDPEFALDENLTWTPEDGQKLEMGNAGDSGGDGCNRWEVKESPELSNGCHDGSNGGGSYGGGSQKEEVMKKGPWTAVEDALLIKAVEKFGPNDWVTIEKSSGLARMSKSCRLRWINHLRPNLKKGVFSFEEQRQVIKLHYQYGNKWSLIAKKLPGRIDNEIKNFWHSLAKKCKKQGLPLYQDRYREEPTSLDDNGTNDDVSDQMQNLVCIPTNDSSSTSLFLTGSSPEFQLASQEQETLPISSDQKLMSSYRTLSQHHSDFVHQSSQALQGSRIPGLGFSSPRSQLLLSSQQPLDSINYISQQQSNVAFQLAKLPTSDVQSHGNQICTTQEQALTDLHEQSPVEQSRDKPLISNEPSLQNLLSPRPKQSYSSTSPSMLSSSTLHQLSSLQRNHCLPAPQPSPKCDANISVSNSGFNSFKPFGPPPILSSLSSRFKGLQRATCQSSPSTKLASFPFPKQGEFESAPAASVSHFHQNKSMNSRNIESPICPLKLNLSTRCPSFPSVELSTFSTAPVSCPGINSSSTETSYSRLEPKSPTIASPHSFLRLKLSTPDSRVQKGDHIIASPGPCARNSLTSDQPDSSLQLDTSTTPGSCFIVKSEPPSIQSRQIDVKSISEINQNLDKAKSKIWSEILDALLQESHERESLFDLQLIKEFLLSKEWKTKHLYGNILRRKMLQNITFIEGVLLRGRSRGEGFSSDLLQESQAREVNMSNRSYIQDFPLDVPSSSSRKQDPLRNITKQGMVLSEVLSSGALLEENTRKEVLPGKHSKGGGSLDLISQREVTLNEGSRPKDLKLIEGLDIEKSLSRKRKGPISESLDKKCSTNTSSKRYRNSSEAQSGKNSGLVTSQVQAFMPGEHGPLSLSASDISDGSLHSAQFSPVVYSKSISESSKGVYFRDKNMIGESFGESSGREGPSAINRHEHVLDALSPLVSQSTATTPIGSSYRIRESFHLRSHKGGCMDENFGKECSESIHAGSSDQDLTNHLFNEALRGGGLSGLQDQSKGISKSGLFDYQYGTTSKIRSDHPSAWLGSFQPSLAKHSDECLKTEDCSCRSLEKNIYHVRFRELER